MSPSPVFSYGTINLVCECTTNFMCKLACVYVHTDLCMHSESKSPIRSGKLKSVSCIYSISTGICSSFIFKYICVLSTDREMSLSNLCILLEH